MDHRDIQSRVSSWYDNFDECTMIATIDELEFNGNIKERISVFCRFEVCPTCEGKGSHVNPSIDSHGITGEEWDRDWSYEDRENYMTGFYDVDCYECHGKRVVPVPDENHNRSGLLRDISKLQEAKVSLAHERIREIEMGY